MNYLQKIWIFRVNGICGQVFFKGLSVQNFLGVLCVWLIDQLAMKSVLRVDIKMVLKILSIFFIFQLLKIYGIILKFNAFKKYCNLFLKYSTLCLGCYLITLSVRNRINRNLFVGYRLDFWNLFPQMRQILSNNYNFKYWPKDQQKEIFVSWFTQETSLSERIV